MFKISNSALGTWQRCKKLYYYSEILNLEPKKTHLPFSRGTLIHALRETLFKHPGDRLALIKSHVKEAAKFRAETAGDEERKEEIEKIIYSSKITMLEYMKLPELLTNVTTEEYVELKLPMDILFTGQVDAYGTMTDHPDATAIYELKTRGSDKPIDDVTERFRPQAVLYALALMERGARITHIIREFIYAPLFNKPSLNKNGTMSKQNITCTWEVYKEELTKNNLVPENYLDMKDKLQYNPRQVVKTRVNNDLLQNFKALVINEANAIRKEVAFSRSWSSMCSTCLFKEPCFLGLIGADEQGTLDSKFKLRTSHYKKDQKPA